MNIRYTTSSGSVYETDDTQDIWIRHQQTRSSGLLRSGWGPMWSHDCHGIGYPLIIKGPPVNPDAECRVITTSPVTKIEHFTGLRWVTS